MYKHIYIYICICICRYYICIAAYLQAALQLPKHLASSPARDPLGDSPSARDPPQLHMVGTYMSIFWFSVCKTLLIF